jgi:LuxR family transcriptional regulator, maltose regulon positive regulatory protein
MKVSMLAPLLSTKLNIPPPASNWIERTRLISALDQILAPACRLALIAAPAGYGKTTLLASWAQCAEAPVAWVSLDEGDNDPGRFMAYLVLALQRIEPAIGGDLLAYLQSPQPPAIELLMALWVQALDGLDRDCVLVLDDYHLISSPAIQAATAFLLDHLPTRLRLIIATRKDPPLSIARLRARGQLCEIRQADLCFSGDETADFFSAGTQPPLSAQEVALVASRTEGWAAGIQMAALSLRGKSDPAREVAAFGAGHEYIVDYFSAEVLGHLPETTRQFLQSTSILDRLCGPLCDALTGSPGSQQVLESLLQGNLFIIPLDRERCWFRYHPLLRDLLRKQLRQARSGDLPDLYRRASRWMAENGMPGQAIDAAFAAGDCPAALALIESNAVACFLGGEHVTLLRWLGRLHEPDLEAHPQLLILQAVMLTAAGKLSEAVQTTQAIDRVIARMDESSPAVRALLGPAAMAHAMVALLQDDSQAILRYSDRAMALLPPAESGWRSSLLLARAYASYLSAGPAACIEDLTEAISIGKANHFPLLVLAAIPRLAETYLEQGLLNQAERTCQSGFDDMDQTGFRVTPIASALFIDQGVIAYERNDLPLALETLRQGLDLAAQGRMVLEQVSACQALVHVSLAQGDLPAAQEYLGRAQKLFAVDPALVRFHNRLVEMRVRVLLVEEKWEDALALLHGYEVDPAVQITIRNQELCLHLVRLLVQKNDAALAGQLLHRLENFFRHTGAIRWSLDLHLLRARLLLQNGETQPALDELAEGLALAEPEKRMQKFVEAGEPVFRLLQEAIRRGIHTSFASELLQRCTGLAARHVALPVPGTLRPFEPLSERELEVLRLVAKGLSNKQIAERLVLSLRTVKFHTGNIYGKLGAESRTDAVAKAQALGLLII